MADAMDSRPKAKHRKSTCAGCRRRKSKCDGKAPKCTTCIAYKDECVYDKPPSLAYVRSLEDEIIELKNQLKAAKTQVWLNKSAQPEEKKILPATSPSSDTTSVTRYSDQLPNGLVPLKRPRQVKWDTDISVDDRGSVSFHNSTSAVHEPPTPQQTAFHFEPPPITTPTRQEEERAKQDLVSNANRQRQLEDFAIANTAAKVNLPKEVSDELLRYHWSWIHPLFLFVYRPAFTRGMTLVNSSQPGSPDPPYFSETLLRVMHAHTARFLNHDVYQQHFNMRFTATEFMQRLTHDARVALAMETLNSSSIPTIQALLQQSAREIVFGRSSQGWLYGGMAFRMAFDMGIHLPSDKLQTFVKSLAPEDIEIRKRLFWSCYTWDKVLSLYLGRMPAFTPATDDVPLKFLDDYSDTDLWEPYYGESPSSETAATPTYTPCSGYIVSCFQQLSRLCIIINDLMQNIYSSGAAVRRYDDEHSAETKAAIEPPFVRVSRNLQDWWSQLPPHLQVRPEQMPPLAPPIHIMSLNLLYHSTLILLHRPVVLGSSDLLNTAPSRSYTTCIAATSAIHDLLILQANTFGLSQISYLNAYCAYTAATIAVLRFERELKAGDDHLVLSQSIGLAFLLDVLARGAAAMPALERSNAIIRKRMKSMIDRASQLQTPAFSPTYPQTPFTMTATTSQMAIAQPTGFQAISNPAAAQAQSFHPIQHRHSISEPVNLYTPTQQTPTQPTSTQQTPTRTVPPPWPSESRHSISFEPVSTGAFPAEDFLPAFPGQQFPVGSEHSFGSGEVDTQSRMALLGYNLDPHPRLNPADIDWSFMDSIDTAIQQSTLSG